MRSDASADQHASALHFHLHAALINQQCQLPSVCGNHDLKRKNHHSFANNINNTHTKMPGKKCQGVSRENKTIMVKEKEGLRVKKAGNLTMFLGFI